MSDKNRLSDSSAKSYSQALYELASEEKKLNDVEEHAISIIMLISQCEDFNSYGPGGHPTISDRDYSQAREEPPLTVDPWLIPK